MATKELRAIQAAGLKTYVNKLTKDDHRFYIDRVIRKCGVPRKTVFNWIYGACCIPERHMKSMEELAGETIFDREAMKA